MTAITISPQPGPQTEFLACEADICLFGGQAGGGKTYGLCIDPISTVLEFPSIQCVYFRRNSQDIFKSGGLWDETQDLYQCVGGKPNNAQHWWTFKHPNNKLSRLQFAGMLHEKDRYNWQGSQPDIVYFDELTQFMASQFWYLIGRLRSRTGQINAYCRATCNPDPGSWVADLIAWWIKPDGNADESRSGIIRWFVNYEEQLKWFDTKKLALKYITDVIQDDKIAPMSLTFIPSKLDDNPILMKNNPTYYAKLSQLPIAERMKLMYGNWLMRPVGNLFNVDDFKNFSVEPADPDIIMIIGDLASGLKTAHDFTVFQVWARKSNKIYLLAQIRGKWSFNQQEMLGSSFCVSYKPKWLAIETPAGGTQLLQEIERKTGQPVLPIVPNKARGDKYTRGYCAEPYIQSGRVFLNPAEDYYPEFIAEVSNFSPEHKHNHKIHDDQVDCLMYAIYYLLHVKIDGIPQKEDEPVYNPFGRNGGNHDPKTFKSCRG